MHPTAAVRCGYDAPAKCMPRYQTAMLLGNKKCTGGHRVRVNFTTPNGASIVKRSVPTNSPLFRVLT